MTLGSSTNTEGTWINNSKYVLHDVTILQIGSYSGLDSSPYGIPSGNHIEHRPVPLVYYL